MPETGREVSLLWGIRGCRCSGEPAQPCRCGCAAGRSAPVLHILISFPSHFIPLLLMLMGTGLQTSLKHNSDYRLHFTNSIQIQAQGSECRIFASSVAVSSWTPLQVASFSAVVWFFSFQIASHFYLCQIPDVTLCTIGQNPLRIVSHWYSLEESSFSFPVSPWINLANQQGPLGTGSK